MTTIVKPVKGKQEDWMTSHWRPMMGMMYMVVCIFDFVAFPILWSIIQFWETEAANDAFRQWNPITLEGAGFFHMAMGAVLGVSAWSRGQEKIAKTNLPPEPPPPSREWSSAEPERQSLNDRATVNYGGRRGPPEPDYPVR
jgi:hypothetical protein